MSRVPIRWADKKFLKLDLLSLLAYVSLYP
jgi:hypothetical protein